MNRRVLIAGVGNVFLSDDGFGVEVAARLAARPLPAGVTSADVGIRGVHLAYDLLDGFHGLVLVDAIDVGEAPGTLAVLEPGSPQVAGGTVMDAHGMHPQAVLDTVHALGGHVGQVRIVGCQPAVVDEGVGLSPAVEAAVEAAADEAVRVATGMLGAGVDA